MGAYPVRLGPAPAGHARGGPARRWRHDQPARHRHHLAGGPDADGRYQGKRHPQRDPGRVQADRAGHLRGGGPAGVRHQQPAAVHALRIRQDAGAGWRRARCDGRSGDHLLRLLRLRCDLHRGRRNQEPGARPVHRHHRLDGRLHHRVRAGGVGRDRCDELHRVRPECRAAGTDHAPAGPADRRDADRCDRHHRPADRAAGLPVWPEPHLLRHESRWSAAAWPVQGQRTHRHAGGDHAVHRRGCVGAGRRGPPGRDRRAGQCRHPGRVHRRWHLPGGAARA
ncbi:hypothetical protein D3C73_734750 [compost metagenome]